MRSAALPALVAVLAACAPAAAIPLGEERQGIATWYEATGEGACSFDRAVDLRVAAINSAQYAQSAACGQCVEVVGPKGRLVVRIVDECPDCGADHLDLSQQAFAAIADVSDGRVAVRWRPVQCDVAGNLEYHFKEGSSEWWTALQVRNHRVPVAGLEWSKAGSWVDLPRERYNYFVVRQGVGKGPLRLRVRSVDGQLLEDTLPGPADDRSFSGSSQFR